jgi:hypothetical protein
MVPSFERVQSRSVMARGRCGFGRAAFGDGMSDISGGQLIERGDGRGGGEERYLSP